MSVARHTYEYVGPPLSREGLDAFLQRKGVRRDHYGLYGADPFEGFAMDHGSQGWSVYYTERGLRSRLAIFATEAAACCELLERIMDSLS